MGGKGEGSLAVCLSGCMVGGEAGVTMMGIWVGRHGVGDVKWLGKWDVCQTTH